MAEYTTGISLRDVRKLIADKSIDDSILDVVDDILGLAIVLSPLIAGPAALPLLGLLEWKAETVKLARNAIKKLTKAEPKDYLDQAKRLSSANCLLTYTAYFDALQLRLPTLMQDLSITEKERERIIESCPGRRGAPGASQTADRHGEADTFTNSDLASQVIWVPNPADSSIDSDARITLYRMMSENLMSAISGNDEIWTRLTQEAQGSIREIIIGNIPEQANMMYHAEFLGMAVEFQRFFLWSVLADQSEKDKLIRKVGADIRTQFELVGSALNAVDIGLQNLRVAISNMPQDHYTAPRDATHAQVAVELHSAYVDSIEQPIIDDTYSVEDGAPQLTYPTKAGCYVPQGYRVALYREKTQHLEREAAWSKLPERSDLGPFLMAHLDSPYSVQTPLLILGHPGSGKSLLTEIIAARLAYPAYTTVRVELRDIDADTEIQSQIEAQIYRDTGREVNWVDFAGNLQMSPPVVIFDGYDELLQATGKLHADYLDRVRKFQHREAVVHHRPVRVFVTSRVTLIDKAVIPPGTTIVRLEEFDSVRREAWSRVWNENNDAYFRLAGVQSFSVPANPRVEDLARQPLLLLMLALYDSVDNKLSAEPEIDQTRLYNELLIRFIERELSKGKDGIEFLRLPEDERNVQIDHELERLGVAAIGMFNRQTLVIQREQLNSDLAYFVPQRTAPYGNARGLSQADLLLGSFFFIHESRSRLADGSDESPTGPSAFEFLHNTFGEFLAADFIIRKVLREADTVHQLSTNSVLSESLQRELTGLPEAWFACLIHTPLHTRPVILDMLREWGSHQLGDDQSRADRLRAIDIIVLAQLQAILNGTNLPALSPKGTHAPYASLPALGQLAIYSLNLILLRCYLSNDDYVIDEADLGQQPNDCRAWDRLTSLWRAWFSSQSLSALASRIIVRRNSGTMVITPGASRLVMPPGGPLVAAYNAGLALADEFTVASMGVNLTELLGVPQDFASDLRERTRGEAGEFLSILDLADARTSQQTPESLSIFSSRYARRFWSSTPDRFNGYENSLPASLPAGQLVEFAEIVDRLLLSPAQLRSTHVSPSEMRKFALLSRYAAEVAVSYRVRLEPRWLPYLLLNDNSERENLPREKRGEDKTVHVKDARNISWRILLTRPAAAPLLRAARTHLLRTQHIQVAAQISDALSGVEINLFDIDTAASAAILAWRGGSMDLCVRTLDAMIESCRNGNWTLMNIPEQLWEDLASVLTLPHADVTIRRTAFSALLDRDIPRFLTSSDRAASNPAGILISVLRIGSALPEKRSLDFVAEIFNGSQLIDKRHRRWFFQLLRWAAENGREDVVTILFVPQQNKNSLRFRSFSQAWHCILQIPFVEDFRSLDVDAVSADLTTSEKNDLKWAIDTARRSMRTTVKRSGGDAQPANTEIPK